MATFEKSNYCGIGLKYIIYCLLENLFTSETAVEAPKI